MLLTDNVYPQTATETNTYGSISQTWTKGTAILCDVQPINKEKVLRKFGLSDANIWKQIFAPAGSGFVEGAQIEFDSEQYLIRLVMDWDKLGSSDHMYVIASRVIA